MTENVGIAGLTSRRERKKRQAPPPRHPRPPFVPGSDTAAADTASGGAPPETQTTTIQESARKEASAPPVSPSRRIKRGAARSFPRVEVDFTDPAAHVVVSTTLGIPASIAKRFELARAAAPNHTAVVLDALRAHVAELPTLILKRRPAPDPEDLFPGRSTAPAADTKANVPLRIRPTRGELGIIKNLVSSSNEQIIAQQPGARPTNQSELIAAALDSYLPEIKRKR